MNRRTIRHATVAAAGAAALSLGFAGQAAADALLVCSGNGQECPAGTQYSNIQLAVNAAQPGDFIQVWPGVYETPTNVTPRADGTAPTGLTIRGMDRNGVLIDGKPRNAPFGIRVADVDAVTLENMSAHNFLTGSRNGFWWTDVDGYWGSHLTAYNTSNYGIYAYASESTQRPAVIKDSYGAWHADSAFYIGECTDCNVIIDNVVSEYNALGYSGTNASGVTLRNSTWRHNIAGIVPNTLNSERDLPFRRVTIENNHIHDNNRDDVPRAGAADLAPVGYGIVMAGGSDSIVRNNFIENNEHVGVAVEWLFTPAIGNQIRHNTFRNNATAAGLGDADITFGALTAHNCVKDNVDITDGTPKPATVNSTNANGTEECNEGNPVRDRVGFAAHGGGSPTASAGTVSNIVTKEDNFKGAGAVPEAQETMANPCAGAPDSAWCADGEPTLSIPSEPKS